MVLFKGTNFDVDIGDTNNFKYFKCKTNLMGNTASGKGFLKNVTIAVSLKYLSNLCRSLKMPLIHCKTESKHKWTKHCVLAPVSDCNDDLNSVNLFFTTKDIKLL